ncbi:MAG: Protein translocase subunit SecF [Parcubacteria group bacterium GW2011_GWB1_41_6]|nr:MAG: Protein translocase subunit SecF [Parcubacteria group bacterium GW2011_GWB1_41_6]KKS34510.1 MAG: Protein translocase subunit SecF [Parcubacteria group bacterium GW2011_GWC2_42_13]
MNFIGRRKITYFISGSLVGLSVVGLLLWGLNLGIDFTGGSLLEIGYSENPPSIQEIKDVLGKYNLGELKIQPAGDSGFILRFKNIDEKTHQEILAGLTAEKNSLIEKRFVSIGPVIGQELKQKSLLALILVGLMIVAYIAFAFRKVSKPVSSWKYGVAAVLALAHDVLIPTGVFSFLGHFYGLEIDILFVTALLTILGFSVHDTIVVFDRIRENLKKRKEDSFEKAVNVSINETLTRSVITSLTVLFVLFALFFLGSQSVKYFSLALILGVSFGTYSSIFLASPLLVTWQKLASRKKA